jgi:glycosyltransferase involved in cell wall biosynthesis
VPPRITILLPVYNGETHVGAAIESALAQTEPDFELVIGDDGSTDDTLGVVARYTDPRIRVVRAERNQGQFPNINSLLPQVRTPLVKFLCHDDLLEPGCIEAHVKFFDEHPEAVMSQCQAEMFDDAGRTLGRWPIDGAPRVYDRSTALQLFFYYGCVPGNLSSVCVRSKAFARVGRFDESFEIAGDYEMWIRMCADGGGGLGDLQQQLFRERHHGGRVSFSARAGVKFARENRRIRQLLLSLIPASVRSHASRFIQLRPNVLDAHHFVSCVVHRRFSEARELAGVMGLDLLVALPLWLFTANNHLYTPKPVFVTERNGDQGAAAGAVRS